MDEGPWYATVHGVTKSQTQLSDFTLSLKPKNVRIFKGSLQKLRCLTNGVGMLGIRDAASQTGEGGVMEMLKAPGPAPRSEPRWAGPPGGCSRSLERLTGFLL